MKVLIKNGSLNANGCTYSALTEVINTWMNMLLHQNLYKLAKNQQLGISHVKAIV